MESLQPGSHSLNKVNLVMFNFGESNTARFPVNIMVEISLLLGNFLLDWLGHYGVNVLFVAVTTPMMEHATLLMPISMMTGRPSTQYLVAQLTS